MCKSSTNFLIDSKYDIEESKFLIDGFRNGFSIGYDQSESVQLTAPNLQLRIGDETVLWNKVMKEVQAK